MNLGSYPALSLSKAREAHQDAVLLVQKGIDPRQHRKAEKAKNESVITMGALVEHWLKYLEQAAEEKPDTIKRHGDRWRLHLSKHLQDIRLEDLTLAHLSQALEDMRSKGIKEETRKALSTLNLCLDFALARHWVNLNPARLLRPKDFKASVGLGRERWLTIPELRRLWGTIEELGEQREGIPRSVILSLSIGNILRILILTGCRRSEVVQMRFSQLEGEKWTIPETKNGKAHTVYLCPLALKIIHQQHSISSPGCDFVFESDKRLGQSVTSDAVTRALTRLRERELPEMEHFTIHDLRRSAATNWAERIGAEERIIELCLNHQPQNKLIRTYHRSKHSEKCRAVWMQWGELVEREIANDQCESSESNVIAVNFGK